MRTFTKLSLFVIGILFIIRLWLAYTLNVIPDEAYYWSWSRNLSWCYYDQPGMIAWLEYLATQLTGVVTPLSARIPMLMLSLGATIAIYLMSFELFGSRSRALSVAILMNIIPVFFAGSFLVMHDVPLLFFWILSSLMLLRLFKTQQPLYFYFLAVTIVCTVYSKFTGIFFEAGLFLFFLLSSKQRRWLKSPHFYLAQSLVIVLLFPILWWNYNHEWVSYHAIIKLSTKSPGSLFWFIDNILSYLGSQFLLFSPLIYGAILFSLYDGIRYWLKNKDDTYLLCLTLSVPVLLYFTYLSFRSRVQPNWSVFGYPMALVLMVEVAYQHTITISRRFVYRARYQQWSLFVATIFTLLLVIHAEFCLIPRHMENLIRKDRLVKEFHGWRELAGKVNELRNTDQVIMALRYQVASELEFNDPHGDRVYCMNTFGRGNQYNFINDTSYIKNKNVLLISENPIPLKIYEMFENVDQTLSFVQTFGGIKIKEYYIYICRNFNGKI